MAARQAAASPRAAAIDRKAGANPEAARPVGKEIEAFMKKITIDEVRQRLSGDSEHLTIVDSRAEAVWESSDIKAAGAIRIPPDEAEKHIKDVNRDDTVVVYCT
jgi:hypothetical protein